MTRDAEATYGHLLRRLRQKLRARNSMHEASLLHVILSSAVFEVVRRQGNDGGWGAHTKGLSQIIQMRGPNPFRRSGAAALFEAARPFIVAEGLKNNHEIFLNQEQWKIKRTSSRSKLWKSTLGDISCQLPSIGVELEKWRITGGEATALTTKVVYTLDELFEWRWRWGDRTWRVCQRGHHQSALKCLLPRRWHANLQKSFAIRDQLPCQCNYLLRCVIDLPPDYSGTNHGQ